MGIPKSESNLNCLTTTWFKCYVEEEKRLIDMEVSVTANKTPNVLTIQCD